LGKDLASMNAGSAVPSMTTEILNNMLIVIPGFDALESFNSICSSIFRIIKHNNQESSRLSSLRDTLLPRLMSGELKINDISV
jgi:type I restriction enzyme S subunit